MPYEERHRLGGVRAQLAGSGMVGQDGDGHWLVPVFHRFVDGAYSAAVEVLDSAQLEVCVAFVAGLVAGFDVEVDKVVGAQGLDGCCCFILVVSVVEAGCSFYGDAAQAGVAADAVDEVYGGDDGSAAYLRVLLGEWLHLRTVAGAPGPDAVGGVFAFGLAPEVEGVVLQQCLRAEDEGVQQVGRLAGRQVGSSFGRADVLRAGHGFHQKGTPGLQGDVVGRYALDALVAAADDEQVAVLHAGVEVDAVIAQFGLQVSYQHVGLWGGDVSGGVVLQQVAFQTDQVAAHGHLARPEVDADAGGFEDAAAFVHFREVVAHDGHVGHLAAGVEACGHGDEPACSPHACQQVHVGRARRL